MRCLESVKIGNVDTPLLIINDFTKIPSSVISSTTFSNYAMYSSVNKPSWITNDGTNFYHSTKDNMSESQVLVLDNEYFYLACPSGDYITSAGNHANGMRIYDRVSSRFVADWGVESSGFTNPSTSYRNHFIGIVLDDDNQRGYIIGCTYNNNIVNNTWYSIYICGGVVNGVDYIYSIYGNIQAHTSNGGGATHIAKVTGQLKDLSSNLSDILIVSGGGGGGMLIGDTAYPGADAGGISGSGDNSADQSTGYAFGQGESGTDVSGGGGGLYGGYKGGTS